MKRTNRLRARTPQVLASFLLLLGLLAGCGSEPPEQEPGATIRIAVNTAPKSLDPARVRSVSEAIVAANLFDTLYRYRYLDLPVSITPLLAADMPTMDSTGLVYTIPINTGVRFSDAEAFPGGVGREVTAADIVYSIRRILNPSTNSVNSWIWKDKLLGVDEWIAAGAGDNLPLPGVVAVDDHTVQFTLDQPFPEFLDSLTMAAASVVPKEVVMARGEAFGLNPIGSGPFVLDSMNQSRAVLKRNDSYRGDVLDLSAEGYEPAEHATYGIEVLDGLTAPFLDELRFDFIPDSNARWISFSRGDEVQVGFVPSVQIPELVETKKPLKLTEQERDWHASLSLEPGFVYSIFNMDHPLFTTETDQVSAERNRALRCAISEAHDWAQRNELLQAGLGAYFEGVIPPIVSGEAPRVPMNADFERAKGILVDAGWDTLPEIELLLAGNDDDRLYYEVWRNWMAELGFPVDSVSLRAAGSFGDMYRIIRSGEWQMTAVGWGLDYPSPFNTLQLFYGGNARPGVNSGNYQNPEFDRLYEEAAASAAPGRRAELVNRLNQILIDDCAVISGMSRERLIAWHAEVIGLPRFSLSRATNLRFLANADNISAHSR